MSRCRYSRSASRAASAYHRLHSTTPQTLAYLLADSPVGVLAWVYERLVQWTDDYPWTDDEGERSLPRSSARPLTPRLAVLTWIHLYLLSGPQGTSSASTSIRIYFEVEAAGDKFTWGSPAHCNGAVPLGISVFPKEIAVTPRVYVPLTPCDRTRRRGC